jgi:hypothetical protein
MKAAGILKITQMEYWMHVECNNPIFPSSDHPFIQLTI